MILWRIYEWVVIQLTVLAQGLQRLKNFLVHPVEANFFRGESYSRNRRYAIKTPQITETRDC